MSPGRLALYFFTVTTDSIRKTSNNGVQVCGKEGNRGVELASKTNKNGGRIAEARSMLKKDSNSKRRVCGGRGDAGWCEV
jgi:hypothetical protein